MGNSVSQSQPQKSPVIAKKMPSSRKQPPRSRPTSPASSKPSEVSTPPAPQPTTAVAKSEPKVYEETVIEIEAVK